MKYNNKKKYQIAIRRLYSTKNPSKDIIELIGVDKEGFITHIDNYIISGMTKENFGEEWGLDHIVPVDLFDFNSIDELKLCYNYINIMPMFNNDNRLKGASVHFSLEKLKLMMDSIPNTDENTSRIKVCELLIEKCMEEIDRTYKKYLK